MQIYIFSYDVTWPHVAHCLLYTSSASLYVSSPNSCSCVDKSFRHKLLRTCFRSSEMMTSHQSLRMECSVSKRSLKWTEWPTNKPLTFLSNFFCFAACRLSSLKSRSSSSFSSLPHTSNALSLTFDPKKHSKTRQHLNCAQHVIYLAQRTCSSR